MIALVSRWDEKVGENAYLVSVVESVQEIESSRSSPVELGCYET